MNGNMEMTNDVINLKKNKAEVYVLVYEMKYERNFIFSHND